MSPGDSQPATPWPDRAAGLGLALTLPAAAALLYSEFFTAPRSLGAVALVVLLGGAALGSAGIWTLSRRSGLGWWRTLGRTLREIARWFTAFLP